MIDLRKKNGITHCPELPRFTLYITVSLCFSISSFRMVHHDAFGLYTGTLLNCFKPMAHCLDRENEFKVAIKDIENGRYLSHKLSNEVISLFLEKMKLRLITSFQEIMVAF